MRTLDYFDEIYKKPFIDKLLTFDFEAGGYKLEFRLFILIEDKIEYRGYVLKKGYKGWKYQIKIGSDIKLKRYIPKLGYIGHGVFNPEVEK